MKRVTEHSQDINLSDHAAAETFLKRKGVKPTSNRILVLMTLMNAESPMSLIELEDKLETLDRSSISRVLTLLYSSHIVHEMQDGRGVAKYEVCRAEDSEHSSHDDIHAHFYCENCGKVICLEDVAIPDVQLPEGFELKSANFMLKGLCGTCASHCTR